MSDSKLHKENRKEICNRWGSIGLTDGLSGCINEKVRELFEAEAKGLLKDGDEIPQFPRIVNIPPHIFNIPENKE